MALVVSKHIELQYGISIRKFIDLSKKVVDGQLLNHATNKIINVKAQPNDKMDELISKIFSPH